MSKVFVVQNQHKWDESRKQFVPKFDLRSAEQYGELVFLLSPTAAPFNSAPIIRELKEKLSWFGDDDYLLLIGNPVLIGCAVAIASETNGGRVRMLQWAGRVREYTEVQVKL